MISIIVPIYKVEKYIKQCVDSIIAQTYKDIEIILVDDGSPDNCPVICDEYAKQDSRVKVVHKANGGLISARKAGLQVSTGEYVCFVDGDDWIEADMYEHIAKSVDMTGADCIITQFYFEYPNNPQKSNYKLNRELYIRSEIEKEIFPTMLFDNQYYKFGIFPNCWTKVFKRELLEKHLMDTDDRIRMGEDIAFTYPCLMECQTIAFVDKALYHYRINPESMTKMYDDSLQDIYILPYETLLNKSKKLNVDLSNQLPYYLLYLVNFLVRNEASKKNLKSEVKNSLTVERIMNNCYIERSFRTIDFDLLPMHTKILCYAIIKKSEFLLKSYIKILEKIL